MTFIRVRWLHDHADTPILLVSELDDARYETRKVEIYRDGRIGWANADGEHGGSSLGQEPTPSLAEIAADPQFVPEEITREEFERVWATRGF